MNFRLFLHNPPADMRQWIAVWDSTEARSIDGTGRTRLERDEVGAFDNVPSTGRLRLLGYWMPGSILFDEDWGQFSLVSGRYIADYPTRTLISILGPKAEIMDFSFPNQAIRGSQVTVRVNLINMGEEAGFVAVKVNLSEQVIRDIENGWLWAERLGIASFPATFTMPPDRANIYVEAYSWHFGPGLWVMDAKCGSILESRPCLVIEALEADQVLTISEMSFG